MRLEFDPLKDAANLEKHGISLTRAADMAIESFVEDDRNDYRERRIRAFGTIDGLSHCLVYTMREGHIRVISLRRARQKELKRHAGSDRDRDGSRQS